jgi:hypothetical protein
VIGDGGWWSSLAVVEGDGQSGKTATTYFVLHFGYEERQGAPLKGTPPTNQQIRRGVADQDGGAHAGILIGPVITDNDQFVL